MWTETYHRFVDEAGMFGAGEQNIGFAGTRV